MWYKYLLGALWAIYTIVALLELIVVALDSWEDLRWTRDAGVWLMATAMVYYLTLVA